ncbi:PIG-L deacetylase family protein [Terriglobus aquaticus]|uniref:PIG-L deacetylase family protein n=1 Tax=Terriglobus aquaticus TaxID=940139 RepID=A0ABW9KS44_9BACT|nr:PIG-L family deacetylase [Terriglobus aquaticus]
MYAHPDDEMIAVGGHLSLFRQALFLQVTNGAPADNADGNRLGLSRDEYRATRALELRAAFAAAGLPEARHRCLNLPDKEAAFHLPDLTDQIAQLVAAEPPDYIFTHPYEGGHPDHDACAFAVHTAVAALPENRPVILESPFYFSNADGTMHTGSFLHEEPGTILTLPLSASQQQSKQAAFAAFQTQRDVLANFPVAVREERFRIAPVYDFTNPAAPGPAFYESFVPGLTAARFSALAAEALQPQAASGAPRQSNAVTSFAE